jgi:hypothetical protein
MTCPAILAAVVLVALLATALVVRAGGLRRTAAQPVETPPAREVGTIPVASLPVPAALIDAQGRIVAASEALGRLLGRPSAELGGTRLADLVDPDGERLVLLLQATAPQGVDLELRTVEGDAVLVHGQAGRPGPDEPTGGSWLVVFTDRREPLAARIRAERAEARIAGLEAGLRAARAALALVPEPSAPAPASAPPSSPAAMALDSWDETSGAPLPPERFDPRAELAVVAARVEAGIPEAALLSPALQRLFVLGWISRARYLEQAAGSTLEAAEATRTLARRLTTCCKLWWPGSVTALQLEATPAGAAQEAGLPPATTWKDVAESVEYRLAALVEEPPADDGWLDGEALLPAPGSPGRILRSAERTVAAHFGPLDQPPPTEVPALPAAEEFALVEAAIGLRWVRTSTTEAERWGAAMGRLRWLVGRRRGGAELPRILDPLSAPQAGWAREHLLAQARRLQLAPPPDEPAGLLDWLTVLFDALDGPTLARALGELRTQGGHLVVPRVLELSEEGFPASSRRLRRRLRTLQETLRAPVPAAAAPDAGAAPGGDDAGAPGEGSPHPEDLDAVTREIRDRLPGARALFVSNRQDPVLRAALTELLGFDIHWCTIEPRRVAAAGDAIRRRRFDVVLSATGFQNHSVDQALARAAESVSVRYVRVNRGRPAACVRALARSLGI